jgi:hypothetical protein
VPIVVIVTILIQTGAIVLVGRARPERITTLERQAAALLQRLTRSGTKLEAVTEGSTEIEPILR